MPNKDYVIVIMLSHALAKKDLINILDALCQESITQLWIH